MADLFLRAIGERLPELVPAGHFAGMSGVTLTGVDGEGNWWMAGNPGDGGHGATAEADGYGPLMTLLHGDNPIVAVELMEARFPIRFHSHRLRREAGGKGLHHGGPGIEKVFEALAPTFLNAHVNRTLDPPWGMAGGGPGLPSRIRVRIPGRRWESRLKTSQELVPAGTLMRLQTGGGGGWGRVPA
jgi:N-methylhydantoinase B